MSEGIKIKAHRGSCIHWIVRSVLGLLALFTVCLLFLPQVPLGFLFTALLTFCCCRVEVGLREGSALVDHATRKRNQAYQSYFFVTVSTRSHSDCLGTLKNQCEGMFLKSNSKLTSFLRLRSRRSLSGNTGWGVGPRCTAWLPGLVTCAWSSVSPPMTASTPFSTGFPAVLVSASWWKLALVYFFGCKAAWSNLSSDVNYNPRQCSHAYCGWQPVDMLWKTSFPSPLWPLALYILFHSSPAVASIFARTAPFLARPLTFKYGIISVSDGIFGFKL